MQSPLPLEPAAGRPSRRRAGPEPNPPPGLTYLQDFITADEERQLVASLERLDYRQVVMHDTPARRTTAHFGWDYTYDSRQVTPADPMPDFLTELRRRAADLIDVSAHELAEVLVTRYPPGATIGWHRDAPMFGPSVVGVSLLASCTMRFRLRGGESFRRYELQLEPRSAYVLGGLARLAWQHSIPPVSELRYSVTFRTLREVRA